MKKGKLFLKNLSIIIFCLLHIFSAQCQEREPPQNTKLRYPDYDIVFKDFPVNNLDPQVIDDPSRRIERGDYRVIFDKDTQRILINRNTDSHTYEYRIGNAGINVHIDTLLQVLKDTVNIEGFDYAGFDYAIEATPNGKPIIIIPKKKGDRFKLSYSLTEFISEQINWRKIQNTALLAKLEKNALHFTYNTKFKHIRDSGHFFFRFPDFNKIASQYEKALKKKMHLRDTLVNLSGEQDDVATLVYKNKPCRFDICSYVFKIERFSNGKLADRKYISIVLLDPD